MIALCFCKMVTTPFKGRNITAPQVWVLSPGTPMTWRCIGFQDSATPYAVVIGDATATQISNLNARADMVALDGRTLRTMQVKDLPAATRTKISNLLQANGVNAGIANTDTLIQAFKKILVTISPTAIGDMQDLLDEFRVNHGYDVEVAP